MLFADGIDDDVAAIGKMNGLESLTVVSTDLTPQLVHGMKVGEKPNLTYLHIGVAQKLTTSVIPALESITNKGNIELILDSPVIEGLSGLTGFKMVHMKAR